ncbi:phosphatidylserine synthase [Hanstruepera neustonica]|uniref:Phosphatidylserine synthase n=1 Tax=Hanstruepera neustonica TaxID=1445657 RepID=A0A2K1DVU3_9FLAO|nr:CDP-alcohol phosphatidyltransferase family protein [Hanstruepera neustonica]PNQ72079.1 phosphatidylserine synthase [Hanstruepera neustonica]
MNKHIPNVITLLNLFSGCIAVILVLSNDFVSAACFVFLGIFFDFFDGLVARKLNVQSALGIQLDSLADMVTSGLVPGLVMYKLLELAGPQWHDFGYDQTVGFEFSNPEIHQLLPFIGLLIPLASAYRLAKFNIDEDQQTYFKGLPTPANAILILSFPLIMEFQNNDLINATITNSWFLVGVTILSCFLLNAPIKLFSLKFKTWDFNSNAVRYLFIILCIILLIVLQFAAIPLIIITYLILSLLSQKTIV